MKPSNDVFTIAELYLLADAFSAEALFGLPDKKRYQLKGEAVFEEAHQRLIEKEIVTSEGKITDGGAFKRLNFTTKVKSITSCLPFASWRKSN